MEVITTRGDLEKALDGARGAHLGLVPTMGALHEGHASLFSAARRETDVVIATVFVNPLQFDDDADLARYPRDAHDDARRAEAAGVDILFMPSEKEIYPSGAPQVTVDPGPLGAFLEGASRPGHFRGVATVVTKLFALVGHCRAYFGEKDFQQLAIVRRLVGDLCLPVQVVGCPTLREPDGLALSSRNRRLSPEERRAAAVLHRALIAGQRAIARGARTSGEAEAEITAVASHEPLVSLEYAAVRDAATLLRSDPLAGELRLLIAAHLGDVRLIDNLGTRVGASTDAGRDPSGGG